jgi:two-component system chemotaxis response regulator CheY/two-component system response regulator (stage 0 sporulation protein A)
MEINMSSHKSSSNITAIVVDDDKDTIDLFSEFLELRGIHILGKGHDGKEAVDLYVKLRPDVIFLDVLMDRFDGLYALEKIKNIDPDANVIMVTADLSKYTQEKITNLRASATIFKPYEIDEVMHAINNISRTMVCEI